MAQEGVTHRWPCSLIRFSRGVEGARNNALNVHVLLVLVQIVKSDKPLRVLVHQNDTHRRALRDGANESTVILLGEEIDSR